MIVKTSFRALRNEVLQMQLDFLQDLRNDGQFETVTEFKETVKAVKARFKAYTSFEHLVNELNEFGYDRDEAFEILLRFTARELV